MINLKDVNNIFIDFDGVIVDSNVFKEISIEKSIFEVLSKNIKTIEAIKYFNQNAGISRKEKLAVFFDKREVSEIMESYSKKCNDFFLRASPTVGVEEFLEFLKKNNNNIKIYILSGGEKEEIDYFYVKILLIPILMKSSIQIKAKLIILKKKMFQRMIYLLVMPKMI